MLIKTGTLTLLCLDKGSAEAGSREIKLGGGFVLEIRLSGYDKGRRGQDLL